MDRFKLLVMTLWLGVLLSTFSSTALAGDVEEIADDLRPASGYVVMPIDGEFLVDLDARHGLRVGDLLSVVVPGEKIVHPVTKEVIGSLDAVKAILKVTRVKSGYSYATRISGEGAVVKGEKIRRFSGMTAAFYATTGQGQKLYARLRDLLPDLEWQGQFAAGHDSGEKSNFDLRFVFAGQELRLIDNGGQQLRTYPVTALEGMSQPNAVVPPQSGDSAAVPQPTISSGKASNGSAAIFSQSSAGIDFGSFKNLGELPGRVLMAAFARDQERLLVATVDGAWVRVFDVAAGLQPVGATRVRDGIASPLAAAWWRPVVGGPLYLAVTATAVNERFYGNAKETSLESAIYEWRGQGLQPLVASTPYFLGSFDRDGDGQPETLLGQSFDLDQVYGRTFALKLVNRELQTDQPPFLLPARFVLPGSTLGDLDGDGQPELITVNNEVLSIFSGGEKVYQSSEQMGGSLASLSYDVNPGAVDIMFKTVFLEVPPAVRDIDGDGVLELLSIASDSSSLKMPGFGPGIKKSWVTVIKYRNGMYDRGRLPVDRENALQGIWEEDGLVYLVESRTTSTLSQEGKSNLLVYPLAPGSR